jgi:hypothetical protein
MISGCRYYKITTKANSQPDTFITVITDELYKDKKYPRELYPEENLEKLLFQERDIYVFDSRGRWHLKIPELSRDTIFGYVQYFPVPEAKKNEIVETRRSRRYMAEIEDDIIKRINFYVDSLNISDSGTAFIPVSSINKCEIYKKDRGKTAGQAVGTFFMVIGGIFVVVAIIGIIAISSSSSTSCPFVYAFDGNAYRFIGEIYGGAVYSSLERDDYLAMPEFNNDPGSNYRIKIANMLEEVQYINQADMLVLTHDSTVYPLVDRFGEVQTISNPILPIAARDSKGNDCLEEITVKDKLTHSFNEELDTTSTSNHLNSLDLAFTSNTNPGSAKLYINGKNSLWGDYMIRQFYNLFGNRYQKFVKSQDDRPARFHEEWLEQQGLLLQVLIQKDGEWIPADYFNMAGAFGSRDLVMSLDLGNAWSAENSDDTTEYTLRIKLVSGYQFWEVDYAAIDLSENAEVGKIWLRPDNAYDQNGKSVLNLLASDDDHYLVQKETGDEVLMDFTIPGSIGNSLTMFLHSKGYYKQAGKNKNEPDITLLESFREPGRLSLWSSQKFLEIKTAYQTRLDRKINDE